MIVLGVDPGLRHTGVVVVGPTGKVRHHSLIEYPERGKHLVSNYLSFILPRLDKIVSKFRPGWAGVEEVQWYGSRKSILVPLSHSAGAIIALLWARGVSVVPILAQMRRKIRLGRVPASWSEHEKDALAIAFRVQDYVNALDAAAGSIPAGMEAMARRVITAPNLAPQPASENATASEATS